MAQIWMSILHEGHSQTTGKNSKDRTMMMEQTDEDFSFTTNINRGDFFFRVRTQWRQKDPEKEQQL